MRGSLGVRSHLAVRIRTLEIVAIAVPVTQVAASEVPMVESVRSNRAAHPDAREALRLGRSSQSRAGGRER